ncbi:DUF397 domain-containing protein [Streptomyces gilvosporeus]|uniref:DUF397 domain-containing protein n=1 Tax=Streptomyces gilvosporeus TaxID=553510 RepID=A0A1V0TSR7_9ACTN|nr:DUF397 domain-containing protein [Streptomyces gilvosporeus]ARF55967.1 hypothetical protein B1H19_18835 [Streptomyces gilvosporeus]
MTDRPLSRTEATSFAWFKSTYSGGEGNECVEVACLPGHDCGRVAVRDSKDPGGPVLAFPTPAFAAFVERVRGTD